MEATLDLTRWEEKPLGVAHRRWTIASTGLRQILRTRFFRLLLLLAWIAGVLMAAAGFMFSQSIAPGGWLETLAANFGPRPQAMVAGFCAFVLLYPDVIVHGLFSAIFWLQAWVGFGLSLVALTVIVPRLVTRDRASNALTIYLSRPLTSFDYLLGKFGIIVGLLLVLWTGPLLFGWLLSVLFAPDRVFITYSLVPLLRALAFNAIALVVLAAIAFGISAITKTSRNTVLLWIGFWIFPWVLALAPHTPEWLRHASFAYDLGKARDAIFQLDEAFSRAAEALPMRDRNFARDMNEASEGLSRENLTGAVTGLIVLVGLSSVVFFRKLRPS